MNTNMSNASSGPGGMPTTFAATRAWTGLVAYVREHVELRCHVVKRVTYDNCFTGADLVDVVLYHIQLEGTTFKQQPTREKAVKICQVISDFQIIESVVTGVGGTSSSSAGASAGSHVFIDSSSKLYRFVTQWDDVGSDMETDEGRASVQNMGVLRLPDQVNSMSNYVGGGERRNRPSFGTPSDLLKPGRRVVQELAKLTQFLRRHRSSSSSTPLSLVPSARRASLSDATNTTHAALLVSNKVTANSTSGLGDLQEHIDVDELTRETALYVLTQIIELPILDGILAVIAAATADSSSSFSSSTAATGAAPPTLVTDTTSTLGNVCALKRYKSICSILTDNGESGDDPWWSAAMRCLECFKRGYAMFEASLNERSVEKQKTYLFRSMCEEYTARSHPLWSDTFTDVHTEMYRLLMEGKQAEVVRAAQISLVLLGDKEREEMKRLLDFLKLTLNRICAFLFKSESNIAGIERTFTPVFFRSKLLNPHQLGQLLMFLIANTDKLWELPDDVIELIQSRLCSLYDNTTEATEKTFCVRLSTAEFSKQKAVTTESALVDMMNSVFDNTRMPLKEKTQMLENFKVHHGELFRKHFPNLA